jgi:hypothetical protein
MASSLTTEDGAACLPAPVEGWLSVVEFAALAGIIERNARAALACCHSGKTWRGFALEVRKVNGKAYQVHAPSLPLDLFAAWQAAQPKPPVPVTETAALVAIPDAEESHPRLHTHEEIELGKWKEKLILTALEFPKRSRARGGVIKTISEREHVRPDGTKCRYSARALGEWVELYEAGGLSALMRKPRQEKGPRVFINRAWDAACPLDDAQKSAISAAIKIHIKSLWATANPGWVKVENLASSKLVELCQAHGWQDATYITCRLGRHIVEDSREYADIHTKGKHAKKFFDLFKPRVARDHSLLKPMEIIAGDVHPVDVTYLRQDGSTATPRMIAWYDVANHRTFYTLVALEPGQGITQADVWASFAAMVEAWGLPERLYLDNGSEYNGNKRIDREILDGLIRGFNELSALVINWRQFMGAVEQESRHGFTVEEAPLSEREAGGIIRALPYNAPGKPGIEGSFASIEKVLSMLPGYIGGDRMKQRTPKLGKKTQPWPNFEALEGAFKTALAYWHSLPQAGNLKNQSPNAVYAAQIATGWRAVPIPREALIFALSEAKTCKVQNDGIVIFGLRYYGDALARYPQQKVCIRVAKWAPERVILVENTRPLKLALLDRDTAYHPQDEAGAKEQSRREGLINRHYKDLKSEAGSTDTDMLAEMARTVAHHPPAQATLFGPAISLGAGVQSLVEDGQRKGPPPRQPARPLKLAETIDPETGKVRSLADNLPMPASPAPRAAPRNLADLLPMPAQKPIHPPAESDPFTLPARVAGQR